MSAAQDDRMGIDDIIDAWEKSGTSPMAFENWFLPALPALEASGDEDVMAVAGNQVDLCRVPPRRLSEGDTISQIAMVLPATATHMLCLAIDGRSHALSTDAITQQAGLVLAGR